MKRSRKIRTSDEYLADVICGSVHAQRVCEESCLQASVLHYTDSVMFYTSIHPLRDKKCAWTAGGWQVNLATFCAANGINSIPLHKRSKKESSQLDAIVNDELRRLPIRLELGTRWRKMLREGAFYHEARYVLMEVTFPSGQPEWIERRPSLSKHDDPHISWKALFTQEEVIVHEKRMHDLDMYHSRKTALAVRKAQMLREQEAIAKEAESLATFA